VYSFRGRTEHISIRQCRTSYVGRCPVGGFASIRAFDNSDVLNPLVQGEL
jgi:hypothetical protein